MKHTAKIWGVKKGDILEQTFWTNDSFHQAKIRFRVEEGKGADYRIEILDEKKKRLASVDLSDTAINRTGDTVFDFPAIIPEQKQAYTLRITVLDADKKSKNQVKRFDEPGYDMVPGGTLTKNGKTKPGSLVFGMVKKP